METDEDHTIGTMAEAVGLSTRKHHDWFDEADKEIQEVLEKKRYCHNHLLAKPDDQAAKSCIQDCLQYTPG